MSLTTMKAADTIDFLVRATDYVKMSEQEINNLNVFPVPDGDTGTNMLLTLNSVCAALESSKAVSLVAVAESATKAALLGARGNSGVILSQIIKGFFLPIKEKNLNEIDPRTLIECLDSARLTAYKAVKKPVEGTMLTIIRFAAEAAKKLKRNRKLTLESVATEVLNAAMTALQKTPEMLDILRQAGVVDAGGLGLVKILEALVNTITEKQEAVFRSIPYSSNEVSFKKIPEEEINFTFCTEVLLKSDILNVEATIEYLNRHGDSVLVVRDNDVVKIHVHTDIPLDLLTHFNNLGEILDVKINNMKAQTEEANKTRKTQLLRPTSQKDFALVAVVQGEGLIEIFKSLGVDVIVEGGQTMNPSSKEILEAIEKSLSENILVLPNNKNVILACEQAASLTQKRVEIIPTTTIQQGLQTLINFNPALSFEENIQEMKKALEEVVSVAITRAVRDSRLNGVEIKTGDYLGIVDSEIVESGKDLSLVLVKTLKKAGADEASFISVFTGKDINAEEEEKIAAIIENNFPEVDYEIKYGGQDHYQLLFAIER
jgi:DAK2 domain fusion protein YloV